MLTVVEQTESDRMIAQATTRSPITARAMAMNWDAAMPIFARPEFLRAAGEESGWLAGIDTAGNLRCFLPYTVVHKAGLRLVRFRMETIACGAELTIAEEQSFQQSIVQHFRVAGADLIIPSSNNAIFRTYPEGASAAPYGTYVIDLQQPEEVLWRNVSKTTRQRITAAQKYGIAVREATESLDAAWLLIRDTFRRSKMGFMDLASFRKMAFSLGPHCNVLVAEHNGQPQSYAFFAFSVPSAYWMYGGNIEEMHPGAMKLLQWEAIRMFRALGVRRYDFYGARIDPPKGSKQAGINQMKKLLGATLVQGYLWKYPLRPSRAWLYSRAVRLLRGGDLVDQEQYKLQNVVRPAAG